MAPFTLRRGRQGKYPSRRTPGRPWLAWYDLPMWRDPGGMRATQLVRHPLCNRCSTDRRPVAADTVNHITPHKGDWSLFSDPGNLESVCSPCHGSAIQAEEKRGYRMGVTVEGRPRDVNHPWNRPRG